MDRKEKHRRELAELLYELLETGKTEGLTEYIASNSNLPSPRGNLELAWAFAKVVEHLCEKYSGKLWELCFDMTTISANEAPVNSPKELIPFCGAVGIGSIGALSSEFFERALAGLRELAGDPRWRMREAVCMGLQRLLPGRGREVLKQFEEWVADGDFLEMRAVAAAVAGPAILEEAGMAASALELHRVIIGQMLAAEERRSESLRILRKGLGYTLSVVVCAVPEQGFGFMTELANSQDADALWVVKQNLKKNRLVKNFPEKVEAVRILLK